MENMVGGVVLRDLKVCCLEDLGGQGTVALLQFQDITTPYFKLPRLQRANRSVSFPEEGCASDLPLSHLWGLCYKHQGSSTRATHYSHLQGRHPQTAPSVQLLKQLPSNHF